METNNTLRHQLRTFIYTLLFIVSLGINAFYFYTKPTPNVSEEASTAVAIPLSSQAFGSLSGALTITPQTASFPPITEYVINPSTLPSIPKNLPVFRDHGVTFDHTVLTKILDQSFDDLNTKIDQYIVRSLRLRTADDRQIGIDLERRIATLSKNPAAEAPPVAPTPADDAEVRALAEAFVREMGLQPQDLGEPRILERTDGSTSKTVVVWMAQFHGYPLLDTQLRPISRVEVQIDRSLHAAITGAMSLLEEQHLASSLYPTRSLALLGTQLRQGGNMPLASTKKGAPMVVSLTGSTIVYLLKSSTPTSPLMIMPALRASWSVPTGCKGCAPTVFSTYVPLVQDASRK